MLPIYTAVLIKEFAIEGGASQPCIMSVIDEQGDFLPSDYVVKVYRRSNRINTYHEVFGSILAKELELQTPNSALISVPKSILDEIRKHPKYQNWDIDAGVYFGCEYLPNATSFNPNFPLSQYELWNLQSIFAFDVLIRNFDRRTEKPNLLSFKEDLFVIDHEMAFATIKGSIPFEIYLTLENWRFIINSDNGGHVLRLFLKEINKKNKVEFAEFFEFFRTLQPDLLYSYTEQLIENDVEIFDIQPIISYLRLVKQNTTTFKTLLTDLLLY